MIFVKGVAYCETVYKFLVLQLICTLYTVYVYLYKQCTMLFFAVICLILCICETLVGTQQQSSLLALCSPTHEIFNSTYSHMQFVSMNIVRRLNLKRVCHRNSHTVHGCWLKTCIRSHRKDPMAWKSVLHVHAVTCTHLAPEHVDHSEVAQCFLCTCTHALQKW